MMADEFNFLRPEIQNYKAEADADLIPIPGQLELHGGYRCGVLLSTCSCALFVADLIVGMEELELNCRRRGGSNFQKIKIATISLCPQSPRAKFLRNFSKRSAKNAAKFWRNFSQIFVLQFPGKMATKNFTKNPRHFPRCTKLSFFTAATLGASGPNISVRMVDGRKRASLERTRACQIACFKKASVSGASSIGRTPTGSCNRTLLRRVLRRFSNSKCFLEGFLEGALF